MGKILSLILVFLIMFSTQYCIFAVDGNPLTNSDYEAASRAIQHHGRWEWDKKSSVAEVLNQICSYMLNEPNAVLNSNVFIMAVDQRKFVDKSMRWKCTHRDIRNDHTWCSFIYIGNLNNPNCAPRVRDCRLESPALGTWDLICLLRRVARADMEFFARRWNYSTYDLFAQGEYILAIGREF